MVDLTSFTFGGSDCDNSEKTLKRHNCAGSSATTATATAANRLPSSSSWSVADNILLTKLVRKYIGVSGVSPKSSHSYPTDWGPIAKELGRGKSEKECEAHWVRHNFHINLIQSKYGPIEDYDE